MATNTDIAVYALYQLGGGGKSVLLERIAHKCYELDRGRFSWRLPEFRKYPDIKTVFYALDEVSRGRRFYVKKIAPRGNGGRNGERGDGQAFRLTEDGAVWINENSMRISHELKDSNGHDPATVQKEELQKLKARDPAFRKYKAEGMDADISIYEIIDFLGCSLETSKTAIRAKFSDMKAKAAAAKDADVKSFLEFAANKHSGVLKT